MPQPSVSFPPDLIHNFIEFLSDDHQTLCNCALVSYSFLHASRKYIFESILLRSSSKNCRPARRLLDFLSISQHLIAYITSLRIMTGQHHISISGEGMCGWIHKDDALPMVFLSLTQLQGISIEGTNNPLKWKTVPLNLQKAVIEVLGRSTLTRLTLALVEDFPIQSLRVSSNLRNVMLHCVTFIEEADITRGGLCSNAETSSALESLQIFESWDFEFFGFNKWLQISEAAALDFTRLKRLSLIIYGKSMSYSEDMSVVSRLLDLCSPSLELLKLTPPLMCVSPSELTDHPFHLVSMPRLRRLEFGLEISDFDDMETSISLSWLIELFSNLPPCNAIEDIILNCEILQANPLGEFDYKMWTKIDEILTCKELACLQCVTIVLYPVYSEAKRHLSVVTELVEREMHILRNRNILHIKKHQAESG